jgi:hypothetical protein
MCSTRGYSVLKLSLGQHTHMSCSSCLPLTLVMCQAAHIPRTSAWCVAVALCKVPWPSNCSHWTRATFVTSLQRRRPVPATHQHLERPCTNKPPLVAAGGGRLSQGHDEEATGAWLPGMQQQQVRADANCILQLQDLIGCSEPTALLAPHKMSCHLRTSHRRKVRPHCQLLACACGLCLPEQATA